MRRMSLFRFLGLVLLLFTGCAHRVKIESDPPGASIKMGQELLGVTPAEITVTWVPYKRIQSNLDMPARPSVVLKLSKDWSLMGLAWQSVTLQTGK